ncbi:MAG TPA: Fe-S-containing protein, partial [Thermodesulfobacteriota bacterium]|nr:Fe-S-containing protein [Thermodesulfobacteriota bacterium]
ETVMEKKIVRLEYEGKDAVIPLVAYITQAGKVVTAVSMCEPCRSTRFHIKEKTLVCNACATEWNLETLQGISGGCLNYPPDVLPSTIGNGKILIDEKIVQQWKPRV